MIRIVIVDDQKIFRETLKYLIEQDSELKVVGDAENGMEAFRLCKALLPDLVLMDISMPVCDGVEGTALIKGNHKSIKVLMLTTFSDDENVSKALNNGADGYILKEIDSKELILAIKSVAGGLGIIHRDVLGNVAKKCGDNCREDVADGKEKYQLSDRDLEIVKLVVGGKSNKEIADELFFSEGSVKNIISGILARLKLKDRTQLAVFALKNKIV